MSTHTIGGVIRPGEPILDIVPESEELVVEARVSPRDIDRVAVGTEATIRFSAFKNATTPTIHAVVTNISADRLVDEQTGAPYYLARVEVNEEGKEIAGFPDAGRRHARRGLDQNGREDAVSIPGPARQECLCPFPDRGLIDVAPTDSPGVSVLFCLRRNGPTRHAVR